MLLSSYFNKKQVLRDGDIKLTHYSYSNNPGTITFVLNQRFVDLVNGNPNICAVITTDQLKDEISDDKGLVVSKQPKLDFFNLHNWLFQNNLMQPKTENFIDESAIIAKSAIIEDNVYIGKNVKIGEYSIIKEFSHISEGTVVGDHVIIGSRGLHNTRIDDVFINVIDAGGVRIGKNCEVLSKATIQKSYFCDETTIGDWSKISTNVNIGHGCYIGKRSLIAGNAVISGYCTIGNDVWIGPTTTVAHNTKIGDKAQILLGSVVISDVMEDEKVSGNFAYSHKSNLRNHLKQKNETESRFSI